MEKQVSSPQQELKITKKKSTKERSTSRSPSNEDKPTKDKKDKSEANGNSVQGRWHKTEHDRFIEAIKKFGKDWKSVEQYIETRSGSQIRSHAQKFFNRIIKKYEIDKTEVINFIQNSYDFFNTFLNDVNHRFVLVELWFLLQITDSVVF